MSSDFSMFNTDKNNIRFKGQMKKKKEFIEKVDKINKEEENLMGLWNWGKERSHQRYLQS